MRSVVATAAAVRGFTRGVAVLLAIALMMVPAAAQTDENDEPRLPWADDRAVLHQPPNRSIDIEEYRIAVDLDFERREIAGQVTVIGKAFGAPVSSIRLHAAEMEILSVTGPDGEAMPFHRAGEDLLLSLPRPLAPGERTSFSVSYRTRPRKGLYFVGPSEDYPDKPVQAWTQGEAVDTRYWVPVFDAPGERARTVISVTVPERFTVISNGALRSVEPGPRPGRRTFVWAMDFAHVNYLISLAVGEFDEIAQEWDGIPVLHYVPPGRREEGQRSFGRTPKMMAFFSEYIGVRYPYPKYAQVAVHDFLYGGMENISATTQTVDTLHDERNRLDYSSDGLVAHELAHQWWGDYVTCRTWAHAWLNEGFATYFDALFVEHDRGRDEFDLRMRAHRKRYLEDDARWRRPLVQHRFAAPMDLFDAVLYQKGAWALHMLRSRLGDRAFRAAMGRHARAHGGQSVETADFSRAVADATGRDITTFLQEWVFGSGHPELEAVHEWSEERGGLHLTVRQVQGRSGGSLFHLPLTVELRDANGVRRHDLLVDAPEQEFVLPSARPPDLVLLDPDEVVLKTLDHRKDVSEWLRQLALDGPAIRRVVAAEALADLDPGDRVIAALGRALSEDPFHGVRSASARTLASLGGSEARDALITAVADGDSRVRTAILESLGEFEGDQRAARALREAVRDEVADAPLAAAVGALARVDGAGAWTDLQSALSIRSHRDVVRAAAVKGLPEVGGREALDLLLSWTSWGRPQAVRVAAVEALGKWSEPTDAVRDRLLELARDDWMFVRREAAEALAKVGGDVAPALDCLARHDPHARVRLAARRSLQKLERVSRPDEDASLADDVEALRRETRRLRDEIRAIKSATDGD